MTSTERLPILIAGAGNIGANLIPHCLAKPELLVSILIRDPSKHEDLVAQVESKGGKVFVGDIEQVEVLEQATKGIHSVISTLFPRGDEAGFVNGQKLLIDASVKNGVKRYYPTDYAFVDTDLTEEEKKLSPVLVWRQKVNEYLKTQPIKSVDIRGGFWCHLIPLFFAKFGYYGDIHQKINFIDIDDVSKLMIGTLLQTNFSGPVYFSSSRMSIDEVAKLYSKVKGTTIESKSLGSLEELKAQAEADLKNEKADPRLRAISGLNYLLFSGKVYQETDDNKKFELGEATPIEESLKKIEM